MDRNSADLIPPRSLDIEMIRRHAVTVGKDLRYFDEIPSTNLCIHDLSPGEYQHGTTVITDYQTAGRGRLGRSWRAAPRTCLLCSVALAFPPLLEPSMAVMVAALAIGDAIESQTGTPTNIKWPNDVVIEGRKVAGILCELVMADAQRFTIVGIGLNVNFQPIEDFLPGRKATSLWRETGQPQNREALAIALFRALDMWYGVLTERPETVFSTWSARLTMLGEQVVITEGTRTWMGVAGGVERDGGLRVQTADGVIRTVYAADVSVQRRVTRA